MEQHDSVKTVVTAVVLNTFLSCIKLFAFFRTGSGALFSEAIHSFADAGNQALLLVGLKRSQRMASEDYPFGYSQERFAWALISACGIFFLGAGVTIYHGIHALLHPSKPEITVLSFWIMGIAFICEAYSFYVAIIEIKKGLNNFSWKGLLNSNNSSAMAVILEDGAAIIGIIFALISMIATYLTGNPIWDAIVSIVIGIMLGMVAIKLAKMNMGLLIEKAMPDEEEAEVLAYLRQKIDIAVISIVSTILDVGAYRLNIRVRPNYNTLPTSLLLIQRLKSLKKETKTQFPKIKHLSWKLTE